MHIHAQSIVELDDKVDLVCSGSDLHVAITTSITISIPFRTCLKLSGWAEDVPVHGQGACDLAEVRLNEAEVRNALEVQAAELEVRP